MNPEGKPTQGPRKPKPHLQHYEHPKSEPVEDLREKLNRKRREEQASSTKLPPPDPKYNFLSDPLRDAQTSSNEPSNEEQVTPKKPIRGTFRGRRGTRRPPRTHTEAYNIKIEVKTTTGERSFVFDPEDKLPDIKHVPDYPRLRRGGFRGFRRPMRRPRNASRREDTDGNGADESKEDIVEHLEKLSVKEEPKGDADVSLAETIVFEPSTASDAS